MKLINLEQQPDGAVTLQLSREDFRTLRDALTVAAGSCVTQDIKSERLVNQLEGASEDEVREALEERGLEPVSMENQHRHKSPRRGQARLSAML